VKLVSDVVRRTPARELPVLEAGLAPLLHELGIPSECWDVVPGLSTFLETVAAHRAAAEERRISHVDHKRAFAAAARRLRVHRRILRQRALRLVQRAASKMSSASE